MYSLQDALAWGSSWWSQQLAFGLRRSCRRIFMRCLGLGVPVLLGKDRSARCIRVGFSQNLGSNNRAFGERLCTRTEVRSGHDLNIYSQDMVFNTSFKHLKWKQVWKTSNQATNTQTHKAKKDISFWRIPTRDVVEPLEICCSLSSWTLDKEGSNGSVSQILKMIVIDVCGVNILSVCKQYIQNCSKLTFSHLLRSSLVHNFNPSPIVVDLVCHSFTLSYSSDVWKLSFSMNP